MKTNLSGPQEHVDQMLESFYRSAMPSPWPQAPAAPLGPLNSGGTRWFSRLMLAASVAFLLLGYWLLAGLFPDSPANGTIDQERMIGDRPGLKKRAPAANPMIDRDQGVNPGR